MAWVFYFARCMNIILNSLLAQLVKYDVYTTRKIKSMLVVYESRCNAACIPVSLEDRWICHQ